jgi:addiction module RelB/DinJ family antitoxin
MAEQTTLFRARVPTRRLRNAEVILSRLGLKPSDAFNMFLAKIEDEDDFPFDVRRDEAAELMQNPEFVAHLEKIRAGKARYVDLKDIPA